MNEISRSESVEKGNAAVQTQDAFLHSSTMSTYGLTDLTAFQRAIVREIALGGQPKAIANGLGTTSQTVNKVIRLPAAQRYLQFLNLSLDEQVVEAQRQAVAHVPAAIDITAQIMSDPDAHDRDRLAAASSFVDRLLPKAARGDSGGRELPRVIINLNVSPEVAKMLKEPLSPELEAIPDVDYEILSKDSIDD